MRIFLAGAAGAIGQRLVPLLLGAGHHVVGTTPLEKQSRYVAGRWRFLRHAKAS
jgi:nucleoside-diphosphate-sugar epimerase